MNNGGRSQNYLVKNTPLEVDRALLDLNLIGTISLTKAVLPHMIDRHNGQVVIVSSILGKFGKVKSLHCNYNFLISMYKILMVFFLTAQCRLGK